MREIIDQVKWGYPKSLNEAVSFFKEGYIPHGGGTTLIRSGLGSVYGLFNVSEIPEMRKFSITDNKMFLGAGLTYNEVVERISQFDREHILVKSLSHAASNPLRNRITIGGSVRVFPYWSDAVGPLIALGAGVRVLDKSGNDSTVGVEEYIHNRELQRESFILAIEFSNSSGEVNICKSFYHREVRTHFDYPFFTVSVLFFPKILSSGSKSTKTVLNETLRIVVTGVRGRYKRLSKLESFFGGVVSDFERRGPDKYQWLVESFGENFSKVKDRVENEIDAEFADKQGVSGEYQQHVAGVILRRGVWQVLLRAKEEG